MTVPGRDRTLRERLPRAARGEFDGIVTGPILHEVMSCVGVAPGDADCVNGLRLRQVENNPLGMQRVAFSSEMLGEIRVALPESVEVAVGEARKTGVAGAIVAGEAAAWKRVSVGVAQALSGSGRAGEVALAAAAFVAPRALRIPVPRFNGELCVLPKRNRLPARCLRNLQRFRKQIFVDGLGGNAIDASA